jgi:hypothetical protein
MMDLTEYRKKPQSLGNFPLWAALVGAARGPEQGLKGPQDSATRRQFSTDNILNARGNSRNSVRAELRPKSASSTAFNAATLLRG